MTKKERREYILNLDKVLKRWVINSKLFCGGCCFSAGQVAKLLEKKHIRYQVVCWRDSCDTDIINLKDIIKEGYCVHIAIQVRLDGKDFIIGGDLDEYSDYSWHTRVITYNKIRYEKLIKYDLYGLKHYAWNDVYDRSLNKRFINILTKSVEK